MNEDSDKVKELQLIILDQNEDFEKRFKAVEELSHKGK